MPLPKEGTIGDLKRKLGLFADTMRHTMEDAVEEAAQELLRTMMDLTRLTDHSARDLERLGHPYAWRNPVNRPHSDWRVHHQQGHLQGGLGYRLEFHQKLEAEIHSSAAHTWYLLLGTRKMRPRDFVSAALIQSQARISNIFLEHHRMVHESHEGRRYRTQVTLISHDEFPAQLPRR